MRSEITLADACSQIVDCEHKTAPIDPSGEHFAVGTPAMRDNTINFTESRRISKETFEAWTRRLRPRRGDLLFAREAPVGPLVRIPPEENVAPGQRTVLLRPDPGVIVSDYLYYLLTSPLEQTLISAKASGSTVAHLNVADVRSFPLPPLPDLIQQRGIAELLGALDDKIAANSRQVDLALLTGDALMVHALDGRDSRVRLGDLVADGALELSDGYRTKRNEHGAPGLRILRAGDVKDHRITATGADFVSSEFSRQMGRKVSQPGDIVLTTKGTVGRVAVVPADMERVVYSPQICYFRVSESKQIDPTFLAAWFRGPDLKRQTATVMFKSDMAPYISLSDIRSLTVPMPDLDRQREIGRQQGALLDLFASKVQESSQLAEMRDALLPQLMSGKIRVKDAERVVEGVV